VFGSAENEYLRELCMDELKIVKRPSRVKSKGNGKNLRLVERDYEILKFILEMGAASSDVIWIGFFKEEGIGKKYAQNRLSRLRASDYLMSHYTPDGAARWYTATKKAKSFVASYYELEDCDLPEMRKSISQGNFFHDKGMCLIRSMLQAKGEILEGSFKSDYLLKSQMNEGRAKKIDSFTNFGIPDGVYENREGIKIALEFERNAKSHKNILKKFSNAQDFEGSDCILFVFSSENVRSVYLNQLKKLNIYRKPFVFMTYDEFVSEYENDFKDFSLKKCMPEIVIKSINDALNEDGCLLKGQECWQKLIKKEVNFMSRDEINYLKEKKLREEEEVKRKVEQEKVRYRYFRDEYIAWNEKGVFGKVLESGPRKIKPIPELDKIDGVVGWWQ